MGWIYVIRCKLTGKCVQGGSSAKDLRFPLSRSVLMQSKQDCCILSKGTMTSASTVTRGVSIWLRVASEQAHAPEMSPGSQ